MHPIVSIGKRKLRGGECPQFQFFHDQTVNVSTPESSGQSILGTSFDCTVCLVYGEALRHSLGKHSVHLIPCQSRACVRAPNLFPVPVLVLQGLFHFSPA